MQMSTGRLEGYRLAVTEQANPVIVTALAAGGSGVARLPDGMTVFVPRTAPGDSVVLEHVQRRRRYATARVARLETAGPDRVEPRCIHFVRDNCGGCQWQHLAMPVQHEAKARIVGDALRRLGRLAVADPEVIASERDYHYRATITLTVRHTASRTIAGFHDATDPSRVFHLEQCWIARTELDALWRALRPALTALPRGDDVRLKLRSLGAELHVVVEGGDQAWGGAAELYAAVQSAGLEATVWWRPPRGVARRMAGREADVAAASFAQVNPEVAALLREAVVREATDRRTDGPTDRWRVLDLYGGTGDTAIPIAQAGGEVVLVELDERAVRQAEERARAAGVAVRVIAARVEDVLATLLPADVVIVNPPRTGLSTEVADRLSARPPDRLLYVSCDPATLARDLVRLGASPERLTVRAFDMFPQTSHVETLAILARERIT
jgi:23S rRNA (uracil1939-C5)-methyltransferase